MFICLFFLILSGFEGWKMVSCGLVVGGICSCWEQIGGVRVPTVRRMSGSEQRSEWSLREKSLHALV